MAWNIDIGARFVLVPSGETVLRCVNLDVDQVQVIAAYLTTAIGLGTTADVMSL